MYYLLTEDLGRNASMRPRHRAAENPTSTNPIYKHGDCFNEAAA